MPAAHGSSVIALEHIGSLSSLYCGYGVHTLLNYGDIILRYTPLYILMLISIFQYIHDDLQLQ